MTFKRKEIPRDPRLDEWLQIARTPKWTAVRNRAAADFFYFVDTLICGSMGKANKICHRDDGPHKRMTNFVEQTEKGFGTDPSDITVALAPRGFLKTTIMVVGYALWRMARNPNIRILLVSESGGVAEERLSAIKTHCQQNEDLLAAFPTLREGNLWQAKKIKILGFRKFTSKEASITARGISSKITGQHFDLILCDDVVGPSNTTTPLACQKVIDYYQQLQPILESSGMTSQLRVVGTVWHCADLHCHLLRVAEREPTSGVRAFCFGIYDNNRNPIWPEVYPTVEIEKIRRKIDNPQRFANQYENRVIDADSQMVTPEKFKSLIIDVPPHESTEWPAFCSVDPTLGSGSDDTAIITWLMPPNRIPVVVDCYAARVRPEETLRELLVRHKQYLYKRIYFEMHDQWPLWTQLLKLSGDEYSQMPFEIVTRHEPGNVKEVRIRAFGEFANQGWVRFSRTCPKLDEIEDQLTMYPRVTHDDIADALSEIAARVPPPPRRPPQDLTHGPSLPAEEMRLLRGRRRSLFLPEWAR